MYFLCMATSGQQFVNFPINFLINFIVIFFSLISHRQISDRGESAIIRTQTDCGGTEP